MLVYYGTFLEFFEFVLFAIMFPVLSQNLSHHFSVSDLASLQYGLLWIGFLGRPLGALVLSPFGDCMSRKKILVISVMGMAFSTILLGCVPFTLNPWITIIYIGIFRLLQGMFMGVEYAVATVYMYERHDQNSSAQSHAVVYLGVMAALGTGAAYFVGAFCHLDYLSIIHFWRAAFILIGFLGLWTGGLRLSRLTDDYIDLKLHRRKLGTVLRNPRHCVLMIVAFFLVGMSFGPWYYLTTFINTYGVIFLQKNPALAYFLNAGICAAIGLIICAIVALQKRYPPSVNRIYMYYILFIMLLFPASYAVFHGQSIYPYMLPQLLLAISSQFVVVNIMPLAPSLFEKGIRLRIFALIQALSSSLLGGGAPLMCHFLSIHFGDKVYASLYPLILSMVSLGCFIWLKQYQRRIGYNHPIDDGKP